MAFTAKSSGTKQFLVPAGKAYVATLDANEDPVHERYLGESDEITVSIAGEKIQEFSSETGQRELAHEIQVGVTRTGKLTLKQVSADNLALFIGGAVSVQAQTTGSVTNEAHSVIPDRYYQLGRSDANPSGVRDVSAVTVTAGEAAIAWGATTAKVAGDLVKATATPAYFFRCTTAGTTGESEPTWVNTVGATTTDGTVTWTCVGILAPELTTDYTLDATLGRIYVVAAARVHASLGTPWAVDYTRAAREREQIKTASNIETIVALRVIADNTAGDNRDWYFPKVSLTASGDLALKQEDPGYVSIGFDLGILKPSAGASGEDLSAIYVDGRAVA